MSRRSEADPRPPLPSPDPSGVPPGPWLTVDGRTVARVEVADTYRARLRGLVARRRLPEALLLRPSSSVHGVGMLVALDVAVLDAAGVVLGTTVLRPFGMTMPRRGGAAVLEAPRGSFARWSLGTGSTVAVGGGGGAPRGPARAAR